MIVRWITVVLLAVALSGCLSSSDVECSTVDCQVNTDTGDGSGNNSDTDGDAGGDNSSGDNTGDGGTDDSGTGTDGNASGNDGSGNDGSGGDNNTGDNSDNGDDTGNNNTDIPMVSGLALRHRSGQTFLTWNEPEVGLGYHVYRSASPITSDNIGAATLLTSRWGPLDSDTSRNKYAVSDVPAYFVVEDLGAPLSDSEGLFVHTVSSGGTAYYAVTTVAGGSENRTVNAGQNSASVQEGVATPQPVLTLSVNGGKGRLYTHYMDYQQWNPTLNGYAFNYYVALPFNYNPSQSYPLQIELHAYDYFPFLLEEVRYDWQVVQLLPIDPGDSQNTSHTWWYGHARDHDYRNGNTPSQGAIENFTEQRVMKAIQETIDNPDFNIDARLTHVFGNSMGASGSVSFGLRYGSVFAGIYASEPMMNYRTSPLFTNNFVRLFGSVSSNLPIVNRGLYSESIQRYGEGGNQPTGVWDWMDHHTQVRRRRGDDFAFMMIDFGKADTVIDWQTQGVPTFSALNDARVAYSATAREGIAHTWRAFDAVNENLFRFEVPGWRYSRDVSYPALTNASGSGRINPPSSGDDEYQTSLEWSVPHFSFGQGIVDQGNQYAVTLRSLASDQTVDVTPRNTQSFNPSAGTGCSWSAQHVGSGAIAGSGTLQVDGSGLATAVQVPVTTGSGTRVSISC